MFEERYLYTQEIREGGRIERIADAIADKMFRDFYAEHDAEKARHRHNRRFAMAENKSRHRGGSKYLDFDWCTRFRPTRAQLKAELLKAEIAYSEGDGKIIPDNMPCIIFPDNGAECVETDDADEAEDVLKFCNWVVYCIDFVDGKMHIYCKEVA